MALRRDQAEDCAPGKRVERREQRRGMLRPQRTTQRIASASWAAQWAAQWAVWLTEANRAVRVESRALDNFSVRLPGSPTPAEHAGSKKHTQNILKIHEMADVCCGPQRVQYW